MNGPRQEKPQEVYPDYVQLVVKLTQLDSGFKTVVDKMTSLENRIVALIAKLEDRIEKNEDSYARMEQFKDLERRTSSLENDRSKGYWLIISLFATNIISIISFIVTRLI